MKLQKIALNSLWWGVCIGGRHYTGSLKWDDEETKTYHSYELERKLSLKEAKQYAEEMGITWGPVQRISNKFESLPDLENQAIKYCEEKFGDNWILFEHDTLNPNRVIAAKGWIEDRVEELTELYNKWDNLNDNERDEQWVEVYNKFDKLISK